MKSKSKRELLMIVPVLILILVLGSSIPLSVSIGNKMEDSASKNLVNATYIIENSVTEKVTDDMAALKNFAESGTEFSREDMELFCGSSGFFRVSRIGRDGTGYNSDGEQTDLTEIGNVSAVREDGKPAVSDCYYSHTGRKALAFGVPVKTGEEITGALYAERFVEDYYSASVFSFYEGAGRGYLVDVRTGDFVLKSLKSDGLSKVVSNLYENLEKSENDAEVVNEIRSIMSEGKTGTAQVNYNEKESYLCFTPVEANEGWYLVTTIGQNDLMAESLQVRRMIILMMAVVVGGLAIAVGIIFAVFLKGRKETERKKQIALLESITSTVDHAFIVYNPAKGKVEYASENVARIIGIDKGQILQSIDLLFSWLGIPAEDRHRIQFSYGTLEEQYERENRLVIENRVCWVRSEVAPSWDGKYVAVFTDISRDKEYAETLYIAMKNAENASKAKSEFLSNMSHDIRTPMNGIIGMTAIASANVSDEERVKDCLKKISDASVHLLNLINEVLDMSKIESGKTSLNEEEFNLGDFMYRLIELNGAAIEHKGQKLSVQVMNVRHETVIADQVKFQQVLTNIVNNANKYTPAGGRIELTLTEKPGNIKGYGCYEFVCRDNGIGMSPEFVKKIFDPFERAQEPTMRSIQGTGLGMAIVKNIVDMMSGIVKVSSTPGKGSVFTVIVNFRIQEESGEEKLPRLPVLVVDDEEVTCVNTVSLLEEIGMDGEWVLTGEEAIEKCTQAHEKLEDYFAVILDWKMPGMNGIETARQIRGRVGEEVPIIILTAYNYEQVEAEAREAGVTAFLPKPLFKSRLYRKLKHFAFDEEEKEDETIRKAVGSFNFKGKRILLAEDNELNTEIAVSLLAFTGAEVESVFHGKEALDRYLSMPEGYYDLVLMDIQMPVMDGYEATRAIRDSDREDAKTLPILAMSANAFLEDREKAGEAGMDGYIVKPIDIQELMKALERWLKKGGEACLEE